MKSLFLIPALLALLLSAQSLAREVRYLARSPRALLMGDAYTALANDEYSLFYNPAALARNNLFSISPLNPVLEVSNALDELDRFKDFPKGDASKIQERLLGLPVYVRMGAVPTVKLGGFALSGIFNNTTSATLRNQAYPELDINYRYDKGFVAGYGHSFGAGKKAKTGSRTNIGLSVKHISREALDGNFDLFGTRLLNIIESGADDINVIKRELGHSTGSAWGWDFAVEQQWLGNSSTFTTSLAFMDVASTRFKLEEGERELADQEMLVSWGNAFNQRFGPLFSYTFSFDLHPLTEDISFGRKVHMGLELNIFMVSVLLGWNGGYPSYGVGTNFGLVKILAGFYEVEIASRFKQEGGKRAFVSLNLLDFSF